MNPYLVLSQKDGRPMYLQIMDQIKRLVAQGEWQPGEKVPSIRELAIASKVSVITIKRAYQELERDGVLQTQPGVGSFVAKNNELGDQIMKQEIDKHLNNALTHAKNFGLSLKELMARLEQLALKNNETKDE